MKHQTKWLWALLALGAVCLCLLLGKSMKGQAPVPTSPTTVSNGKHPTATPQTGTAATQPPSDETAPTLSTGSTEQSAPVCGVSILEEYGLAVTSVGSYTGAFVEDGSDELVTDVAMLVLENRGPDTIQYAALSLSDGTNTLNFTLSTLPPDNTVVLLEQNRQPLPESGELELQLRNIALFSQPLSCQEDLLEIQILDGAANIKNISGEDIAQEILLYYKNCSQELLYGGITYRLRIPEGLKDGEIRQIIAEHLTASSRIMFVTIG